MSSSVSIRMMGWVAAFALVCAAVRADSQVITVTTFAGPQEVPGVADGVGTDARFQNATSIAVDRQGNVYVADQYNHSIRKASPAGAVTTLAGHFWIPGQQNGSGSIARFDFPQGVATDASDNVYVADTYNGRIRKITPQGVVSTLAGGGLGSADGPAATARFQLPAGIAVAPDGTVYVADTNNHTIRKVTPTGDVTTLAGTAGVPGNTNGVGSAAGFYYPQSLALDQTGNIYVVDQWNHAIRKVTPQGTVSTFCGGLGLRGTADGPCAAARFAYPAGIAVTSDGEFIVADTFNYCLRKIDANGRVSTIAGSSNSPAKLEEPVTDGPVESARFGGPQSVAVDAAGAIYVLDGILRKISNGQITTLAGQTIGGTRRNVDGIGNAARFESPQAIAADSVGNLYVADEHTIRMVTAAAEVSTIAGTPLVTGSTTGSAQAATFNGLRGIAVVGASVYVADSDNNAIKRISGGTVTTFAGSNTPLEGATDGAGLNARFRHPKGIAADSAGNLFVADWGNNTIRKITPSGAVSTIAGSAQVSGSADGSGSVARFNQPLGVAVDVAGNVYVTDSGNYTIRKISPSGEVTTLAGVAGSKGFVDDMGNAARFKSLYSAITSDRDGTVYVADDATIRRIDPDGKVTTIAGTPNTGGFTGRLQGSGMTDGTGVQAQVGVSGLVAMPNGTLFMTDNGAVRLGRPTIPDIADGSLTSTNPEIAQLTTVGQNAIEWNWRIMRRPADARATLSSSTVRSPTFRSDVPGLFVFRLTASGPAGASVSYLEFMSNVVPPPPPSRRRAAKH